jgi:cytidylate kinase
MKRERGIVIAVDGPSGAGKSTISRALSKRLGYLEIDTGAMYRAMAWLAKEIGLDCEDPLAVQKFSMSAEVELQLDNGTTRVLANGQEVTQQIRTPEISMLTSRISALAPVREAMMTLQRRMGAKGGVILDGRDIGTVVFPDAELKFFLSASAEERGRRRFLELQSKGIMAELEETIQNVVLRDKQDSERELAPLRQADDAIAIDSTGLTIDQVIALMEKSYRDIVAGKGKQL